jgi:uncharacterized membrane protein
MNKASNYKKPVWVFVMVNKKLIFLGIIIGFAGLLTSYWSITNLPTQSNAPFTPPRFVEYRFVILGQIITAIGLIVVAFGAFYEQRVPNKNSKIGHKGGGSQSAAPTAIT